MIRGSVRDLEIRVDIPFRVQGGHHMDIEFVVDTGFAGALTLPADAVFALGLPFLQEMVANLADDTAIRVDVHVGTIRWNGLARDVAVLGMGSRPLVSTALLDGHRLEADFGEDGAVIIETLKH